MNMVTSMVQLWASATDNPTNVYVGKSGGNLTWNGIYKYNVASSINGNPTPFQY